MVHFRRFAMFLSAAGIAIACGGGGGDYNLPVDHPIKPFQKPEREDLLSEEDEGDWDLTEEETGDEEGAGDEDQEATEEAEGEGAASDDPASRSGSERGSEAPSGPPKGNDDQ